MNTTQSAVYTKQKYIFYYEMHMDVLCDAWSTRNSEGMTVSGRGLCETKSGAINIVIIVVRFVDYVLCVI
jgi:hypothetical protein